MKSIKFLFIALFSLSLLAACNKLTQKNIIGEWHLTAAKFNGVDVPLAGQTWVVVFNDNQTGTSTINGNSSTMVWSLDEDAQTITFPSLSGPDQVYTVLEKKGNTLMVKYEDSGNTYEYTFEKQ
ncbi:MAG: lipocalin family protein [Crocinitomicaceae bacterium]